MTEEVLQTVIFGAGVHGRAAFRALSRRSDKYAVMAFCDNDPGKHGSSFAGVPIISPRKLAGSVFDIVAVAGRSIDDICLQIVNDLGIPNSKLLRLKRSEIGANDEEIAIRSKDTDHIVGLLTGLLEKFGLSYWIDTSSLLALHRGVDLANFSDVDVTITEYDQLLDIAAEVRRDGYAVEEVRYKRDTEITPKGRLHKLVISSHADAAQSEPACVDMTCKVLRNGAYLMPFRDRFLYTPAKQFGSYEVVSYHGLNLRIPYRATEYLELIYGKDWSTPAEFWSDHDYGNLTDL